MKRGFEIGKEDGLKLIVIMRYLFNHKVDFTATYRSNGDSVVLFECDDQFYEQMINEVPEFYSLFV